MNNLQCDFYDDDDLVYDGFEHELEEDDFYDDSTCCYEYGYKYGNYCHCAASAECERRASHWFWSRYDSFIYHFTMKYHSVKDYFTKTRNCSNCEKDSLYRKWNGLTCPKCGVEEDLPF